MDPFPIVSTCIKQLKKKCQNGNVKCNFNDCSLAVLINNQKFECVVAYYRSILEHTDKISFKIPAC